MIPLTWEYLDALGLNPALVLDVGVFTGTEWLYRAWPGARHLLIDPQCGPLKYEPSRMTRIQAAAGMLGTPTKCYKHARVVSGHGTASARVEPTQARTDGPTVPIKSISQILRENGGNGKSFVLKVDAEGWDSRVIQSMGRDHSRCLAVIVELPRRRLFGYAVNSDIVRAVSNRGFSLYEWFAPDWPHDDYRNALFLPDNSRVWS